MFFKTLQNKRKKMKNKLKTSLVITISYLYIFLFVYAAISKILDFENFQAQLGQSPLLSAYASIISYLVIITEIAFSILLAIPKYRIIALYLSVGLMSIFSTYIVLILNFSSFIPCSCGGVLEKLGWTEHLIFNLFFVVIGIIAILIVKLNKKVVFTLFILITASISSVVLLFLSSEDIMQKQNPFIRRFTPNSAEKTSIKDLNNYGFYFVGQYNGKIYLGNKNSPLTIIELDSTLKHKKQFTIQLNNDNYPFRSVKIKIMGSFFYLYDGSIPIIYRGLLSDWKANVWIAKKPYFTLLQPVDSNRCVFRGQQLGTNENVLGIIELKDSLKIKKQNRLLQKQIDGLFDTDGTLVYSEDLKRIVYTYFYRNQFIVADTNLTLIHRGNTIDTTSQAKLKVVTLKHSGDTKLATPPQTVNIKSTVYNQLLFNQSGLRGRYESVKNWEYASIIDVYDITQNTYISSFYIYNENKMKMSDMMATDKAIYAIIGHRIVKYSFGKPILTQLKK